EIAILYRSNAQSRVLEEALLRAAIPYRIYGGQRFFERAEIKNAMAYMRLIASRGDDGALERIINVPARGIGERTVEILRQHAREQDVSMWQAACDLIDHKGLPGRAANAAQGFMQTIEELAARAEGVPLYRLAHQGSEARGIGERTVEILRQHAREQDVSMWQAACDLIDHKGLPGRAANAVQGFMQMIEELAERVEGVPLYSMAQQVIEHSGLLDFHRNEKGEKAQ